MKQKEVFSGPALGLSVLTAALADAAAPAGSVRTALLSGLLNAAVLSALILLAGAFWQRSQAFRLAWMTALPLWLLAELARTVLQAHAVCREEFRSMALLGALPLLLWAGGQLAPGSWNAAARVLWWMVFLGLVLCLPGLLGQAGGGGCRAPGPQCAGPCLCGVLFRPAAVCRKNAEALAGAALACFCGAGRRMARDGSCLRGG